jgi:hypothetical protein
MAPGPRPPRPTTHDLPVGSVVEQRQGSRTVLVVQESRSKSSIVESWEDGFELTNRLLRRLKNSVEQMNADMSLLNERLTAGIRETNSRIKANQRLLDKLVKNGA